MCLKENSSLELSKPQLFHFCVDSGSGREKSCPVIKLSLALLFSVVLGGTISAEEKAYKSIFDGKTLKGWTQRNGWFSLRLRSSRAICWFCIASMRESLPMDVSNSTIPASSLFAARSSLISSAKS